MIDMGCYKTFYSQTFRCHFDPDNQIALARGPLPDLTTAYEVEAEDEKKAAAKLAREIGMGVFTGPVRK